MNPDGSQPTTLLSDANSQVLDLAPCGDRYVLLAWTFHGGTNDTHIWRADTNGSNLKNSPTVLLTFFRTVLGMESGFTTMTSRRAVTTTPLGKCRSGVDELSVWSRAKFRKC